MDLSKIEQFDCLIQEIIAGRPRRHTFLPWQLALLLDIQSCAVRQSSRADLLRRYMRAARQDAADGRAELLKFSEFLLQIRRKRQILKVAAAAGLSSN